MAAESFTTLAILKARDEASSIWDRVSEAMEKFKHTTEDTAAQVKVSTRAIDDSLTKTASGASALEVAAAQAEAAQAKVTEATKAQAKAEEELLKVNAQLGESSEVDAEVLKKQAEVAALLTAAQKETARATKELTDAQIRQAAVADAMAAQSGMKVRNVDEDIARSSKKATENIEKQKEATKDLDGKQKAANKSGEGMSFWMKALIGYALPLAPALVGAAGGFAAFGAMAMPQIKSITDGMATIYQDQQAINSATDAAGKSQALKQMKADWDSIPPAQRTVIQQAMTLTDQYKKMGQALQPQVLGIFGSGLKVLTLLMPQVSKLAQIGGTALQNMMGKLASATSSKGALQFFDMLDKTAQQVLPLLGQLAGSLGGLLAHALEALAPAAGPALQLLTDLIKALDGPLKVVLPALAGAFTQLVDAIAPFLPQISSMLSSGLTDLVPLLNQLVPMVILFAQNGLGTLLSVAHALGVPFRDFVGALGAFLRFINPLVPLLGKLVGWFLVAKTAIGAVKIAMAALNLVMDANPISLIIIGIAALVAAFYLLWKNCAGFRDFWKAAWNDIKIAAEYVWHFLNQAYHDIIQWSKDAWHAVQDAVKTAWDWVVQKIKTAVRAVRDVLDWFGQLGTDFHHWWNDAVGAIEDGVNAAINWFKSLPDTIKRLLSDAGSWLLDIGKHIIEGLWNGISGAAGWLKDKIKGIADTVVGFFKNPLSILSPSKVMADEVGKYIPLGIAKGIEDNLGAIRNAAKKAGNVTVTSTHSGVGGGLPLTSGAAGGSGGVYVDLRGSQMMTERDMDLLVNKVGRALAVRTLPSGGLRVAM